MSIRAIVTRWRFNFFLSSLHYWKYCIEMLMSKTNFSPLSLFIYAFLRLLSKHKASSHLSFNRYAVFFLHFFTLACAWLNIYTAFFFLFIHHLSIKWWQQTNELTRRSAKAKYCLHFQYWNRPQSTYLEILTIIAILPVILQTSDWKRKRKKNERISSAIDNKYEGKSRKKTYAEQNILDENVSLT